METAAADPDPGGMNGAASLQPIQQRLSDWITGELGACGVRATPPGPELAGEHCVSLYLMSLAASTAARGPSVPLEFALRWLVTVWGDEPAAQEQLCRLAFAALEMPEAEVDFEPLPWSAWASFGVAPRPAFVLQLPLRKTRPVRAAPRVRQALRLTPVPMRPLIGRVVGPGDVAVMDAKVTLLTLDRVARTDADGGFRFDGVPTGQPLRVRVHARGTVQDLILPAVPSPDGPPWVVDLKL